MRRVKTNALTLALAGLAAFLSNAQAATVCMVENGQPRIAIVADEATMAPDAKPSRPGALMDPAEKARIRVRESVKDLALYLQKMSGAEIEILTAAPADGRLPLYVGACAEPVFGKVAAHDQALHGFRFVVTPKAIGLYGESPLATSYAVYELQERP